MNTLISILLSIINNTLADHTVREIAIQLLRSYPQMESIKAAEIAEKSYCSAGTVNRFVKSIGFQSFPDLKSFMISTHNIRQEQLTHHMNHTDEKQILSNIAYLSNGTFDEKNFREKCFRFNQMLSQAPQAVIIGAVYPEALTFHYMEDMIEMGKCIYNTPVNRQLTVPAEDSKTAVILISFTGRLISYCANEYRMICERYPGMAVMSADEEILSSAADKAFPLPFKGDDEANNAAFIEIMRYLKYDYYHRFYLK